MIKDDLWLAPRRPAEVSPQQWGAYLRRRAQCPLFAHDPNLVRPPRTRGEQEEFRLRKRTAVRRMFRAQKAAALWEARRWYWALRRARVPAAELWGATRVWRKYGLGEEYLADAFRQLARRYGLADA